MNRKKALILILILFTSLFPLIPIPIAKAYSKTVYISNDFDDVWMTEAGNIFSSASMVIILDESIGLHSFLRFQDVQVAKTVRINNATLHVFAGEVQPVSAGASVTVYGIDEPDCAPFSVGSGLWSLSRPYTSASVNWDLSNWAQGWHTVNVTDIVKEIINQYAWDTGNDLGFQILGGSDSGKESRSFEDYYHPYHDAQAYLTIVYDVTEEEDPPADEYDFIEQYGDYTIWRRNGSGGVYFKDIVVSGSTDGALEDYYVPIKVNTLSPFADNGKDQPLYFGSHPSAVYHNGLTYIVWQGDAGFDPYIIAFNHSSDTFSDPVKIGTNPLSGDYHGVPAIMVDNQSYIHVFYGCHNSNLKYSKSDNPEDITAWTLQGNPTAVATYPVPVYADNKIYLFYREADFERAYRVSDDNGASWGAENTIIQSGNPGVAFIYTTMAELSGTKIHMVWRHMESLGVGVAKNVYHAYLETTNGHMYSMDGTDLGTSITKAEADTNCKAVDSGADNIYHMAMHVDGDGYPYIIYNVHVVDTAFYYRFTRWTGSNWIGSVTLTETDWGTNTMDFIVYSSTNITAFLVAPGEAGKGGDLNRWTLSGTTWTEGDTILSQASAGRGLNDPKIVLNHDDELKLVFAEYLADAVDLRLFASDGVTLLQAEEDIGRMVYLSGLCKNDFGDIRFTNYNGASQIEHWLEEKVDGSYGLYWVKIPNIPASPDNVTIRIYWGDQEATSESTEAREDFTTYTEVEEIDDIQKTEYHVDFLDIRSRTTYLYKDYTTNYLDSFAQHLNVKRVTHADGSNIMVIANADVIKGDFDLRADNDSHIAINIGGTPPPKIRIYEKALGVWNPSTPEWVELTLGTMYYLAFRTYENSTVLDTYTSIDKRHAGGDGDQGHQVVNLTMDYSFRYNYIGNTFDDGASSAGSSDMESLFFRDYVEGEPDIGDWGELTEDGDLDEYFILDENGTLVDLNGNFTSLDDAQDALDDYTGGDPLDPNPGTQGWDTEGPFTRFKTRLYILFIGLGCFFTPLWAMAYKKFDAVGYAGCFIIMVTGIGLLWSITGI